MDTATVAITVAKIFKKKKEKMSLYSFRSDYILLTVPQGHLLNPQFRCLGNSTPGVICGIIPTFYLHFLPSAFHMFLSIA